MKKQNKAHVSMSCSDTISMISAIISFLSVFVMLLTIYEMKIERDMAYRPAPVMNPTEVSFSWNENKLEEWGALPADNKLTTEILEDGTIQGDFSLSTYRMKDGFLGNLDIVNVGVGVAKDIRFTWRDTNTDTLVNHLTYLDETKADFCSYDQSAVFQYGDHLLITNEEIEHALMYLLPEANEECSLAIPAQYSLLIHEIIKTGKYNDDLYIILDIEYKDIHAKDYFTSILIQVKELFYSENTDGSGEAVYQLAPIVTT